MKSNVSENERVRSVLRGARDLTANENDRKRLGNERIRGLSTLEALEPLVTVLAHELGPPRD